MYNDDEIIELFEKSNGIALSDEQKIIIKSPNDSAYLINAAAGAGKTTLQIMKMIASILRGESEPDEMLAITFSSQAQSDMAERYNQYVEKLKGLGVYMPPEKPTFSTFHAFFYRILRQLPQYAAMSVLPSYKTYTVPLSKAITHSNDSVISKSDILERIFNIYQFLINTNQSIDGLYLYHSDYEPDVESTLNVAQLYMFNSKIINNVVKDDLGNAFWSDYVDVITTYTELKTKNFQMDFNDMSTFLAQALDSPFEASQLIGASSIYSHLMIDEFQDINHSQWELMQRLILPSTMAHLIAIGDNDQAIYGFRGSTPEFIMEFEQIMPKAKVLNLSTNYRTGGNILNEAKKIIEDNQYRLPKQLVAFKKNQGQVVIHKSTFDQFSQSSPFLQALLQDVNDPTREGNISILTRYNSDAMLIIDWLARNKVYVNTPSHLSLSKNKLYSTIMTIAYSFYQNNITLFQTITRNIGFKSFKVLVDDTVKTDGITELFDLTQSLKSNMSLTDNDLLSIHNIDMVTDFVSQYNDPSIHNVPFGQFFQLIKTLTSPYYSYMLKHKYIPEDSYAKIINYMYQLFLAAEDDGLSLEEFFQNEESKNALVDMPVSNVEDVYVSSIHQSKGLEYDNVYLFGLKENPTDTSVILLEKIIGYDFTEKTLQNFTLKRRTSQILFMKNVQNLQNTFLNKFLRKHPLNVVLTDDIFLETLSNLLHMKFDEIEEERRLIYVGMTRAKSTLHLDSFIEMSPLLNRVIH